MFRSTLVLLFFVASPVFGDSPKKVIQLGWDQPTTAYLRENHVAMEATVPFDGVAFIYGNRTQDGRWVDHTTVLSGSEFPREVLQACVDDLKACKFTKFTDNFARVNTSPGNLSFADDAAWKSAAANMGHVAWMVHAAGAKGIMFDAECYGAMQWTWDPRRGRTFEQESTLARRRGRQVMAAMAAEFPEMVMFHLFGPVYALERARAEEPSVVLPADNNSLWIPFFIGMLEAMPPEMRMIEGNEHGYKVHSETEALRRVNEVRNANGPLAGLFPAELRGKYRAQVDAGLAIYLDAFVFPEGHRYYIGPTEELSRVERLRELLAVSLEAVDEYVWVYGERGQWWDRHSMMDIRLERGNKAGIEWLEEQIAASKPWEKWLPGVAAALRQAKNPLDEALKAIQAGHGQNLVRNGDFEDTTGEKGKNDVIPGWGMWSADRKGRVTHKAIGSGHIGEIEGVWRGSMLQDVPVSPGKKHVVTGLGRSEGGLAFMTTGWRNANRALVYPPRYTISLTRREADGWRRGIAIVVVPEGVTTLLMLLDSSFCESKQSCQFDNVGIYEWNDLLRESL